MGDKERIQMAMTSLHPAPARGHHGVEAGLAQVAENAGSEHHGPPFFFRRPRTWSQTNPP